MIKIKFLQFLQTLDKREIKDFKKFASSDYFSHGRDFNRIISSINRLLNKKMNSKEFIKTLNNELGFSSRTIWNRLHELLKIAENYIVLNEVKKNRIKFDKIVGTYFLENNAYNLFEQKYKANIKSYRKGRLNINTFQNFYEVLQTGGHYYIYTNKSDKYFDNLSEQVVLHSASYMVNHYLHLTELLQVKNLTSKELAQNGMSFITDSSSELFLSLLKQSHKDLYNIVNFHYRIYKAFLNNREDENYNAAIDAFDSAYGIIDDKYRSIFYQILINYCINRTNLNDRHYYNELFRLYNRKLEDGLHQDLRVGNFPINNFRDYIFVALQLGEIEWIRWFIDKYSGELPDNVRNDETNLSWGIVYYHEGDFELSLRFLNKVAGENYIHYMDSKYYRLRMFYETGKWEEAFMEIDNYKHYVRSHKEIPETFIKPYRFFIREFSNLLKIRLNEDSEAAELFKNELAQKAQSPRRVWIIKKLNDIIR